MPADPETLAALDRIADRLEKKIDDRAEKADGQAQRLHQRMNEIDSKTTGAMQALALQLGSVSTELGAHTRHDDEVQARHEAAIKELEDDRGKVWRAVAGLGASGALGATVAKWFESGGGA